MTGSKVWPSETLFSFQRQMRRLRQKVTAREKRQDAAKDPEKFVHCNLDSWVHWVQILCTYIFYSNVQIASLLWIKFIWFHLPTLLLEFTGYFQRAASLPTGIRERRRRHNFFFRGLVSRKPSFLQIFCVQPSKLEPLYIAVLYFQTY